MNSKLIEEFERGIRRSDLPPFGPGDQIKVHLRIQEGEKERIQVYEGTVINRREAGLRTSFTVRKISYGVGVERIFPLHARTIDRIEVIRHGRVRRAKLYFLRGRGGKKARLEEKS
jgi:large subunit ribosomal protein L19